MTLRKMVFPLLRLVMGFIFFWAFLDKLFGLGFTTTTDQAWLAGSSPTTGFLTLAVRGPLAEVFHSLAGLAVVDWLFMLGLLFVGLILIFNRYLKWGCLAGGVMLLLMYLALNPPENNPIIDQHIVYILVLALLAINDQEKAGG